MAPYELTPEEMELFLTESAEQVDTMEELLITLEESDDPEAVAAIFRAAHTLKGGAATAGMEQMAALTHSLESLLDQIRSGARRASGDIVDALLEAVDLLRYGFTAIEEHGTDASVDVAPVVQRLEALRGGESSAADVPAADVPAADVPQAAPDGHVADTSADVEAASAGPGGEFGGSVDDWAQAAADVGERLFHFAVAIDVEAPMPTIRLYQALMVFEEMGRVVETAPSRADIEAGATDHFEMDVLLATGEAPEHIREALSEVSHLDGAEWDEIEVADTPETAAADVSAADAGTPPETEPTPPAPTSPAPTPGTEQTADGSPTPREAAAGVTVSPHVADTVRVSVRVLDRLMNLVGELVIDRTRLARLGHVDMPVQQLQEELELVAGHVNRITTDLQDTIMTARMVPLETLFRRFPRMARDLARRLDKQVRFVVAGEDTELDRAVIEHIGDPLVHLIRNAIDHGLESAAERETAGKSPEGTVRLAAYHQENHIYIEVSDDGRGIDADKVKQSAVDKGLITAEAASQLQRSEALDLLFMAGFSTTGAVSDVSGRGVGLDVVRRNIERVNGSVAVRSDMGEGTVWTIRLPLTLAIVQALLVDIGGTRFAIPLDTVMEIFRVSGDRVSMANGRPVVPVRDQVIPLVNPGDVWGDDFRATWDDDAANPVVVLQSGSGPLALVVDTLIGEQETVIKTIDGLSGQIPGISGASILGDGSVALIIDVTGFTQEVRSAGYRVGRHSRHHGKSA